MGKQLTIFDEIRNRPGVKKSPKNKKHEKIQGNTDLGGQKRGL